MHRLDSKMAGAKAVGFEAGRNNDVGRNETQNKVLKLCSDKPRSDNHGRNISFVEIWPVKNFLWNSIGTIIQIQIQKPLSEYICRGKIRRVMRIHLN